MASMDGDNGLRLWSHSRLFDYRSEWRDLLPPNRAPLEAQGAPRASSSLLERAEAGGQGPSHPHPVPEAQRLLKASMMAKTASGRALITDDPHLSLRGATRPGQVLGMQDKTNCQDCGAPGSLQAVSFSSPPGSGLRWKHDVEWIDGKWIGHHFNAPDDLKELEFTDIYTAEDVM